MSDPTSPGEDFRGTRASKRQQETVMLGADDLSSLVDQAKADPTPAPAPVASGIEAAPPGGRRVVLVVAGVVVLIALVALIVVLVS